MSYFDKDFFKFFLGFAAIITFSLVVIIAARLYQENTDTQTASVFEAVVGSQ